MLDGEFFQINKIFVALHEHNVALMAVSDMGLDIFISSLDQYLSALCSITFISGNSSDVDM
jgi:hypothetical protein